MCNPARSVLEIGFGTGNSLVTFADQVGDSGSVSGIDISPGMKAVAEKKLKQQEVGGKIELKVGDARELPFKDDSFDAVFSSFTLELFPVEHIPIVLKEIARVLKPKRSDGNRFDGDRQRRRTPQPAGVHLHLDAPSFSPHRRLPAD